MELVFDIHQIDIMGDQTSDFNSHILIFLTGPDDLTLPDTLPVKLSPGKRASIRYTVEEKRPSEAVRTLSIMKRGCRLENEVESSKLFKKYNRGTCRYEFALQKATIEQGCTPWNYIHLYENYPICTRDHTTNFTQKFSDALKSTNIDKVCLPSCTTVTYKIQLDTANLNPDLLCLEKEIFEIANPPDLPAVDKLGRKFQAYNKWYSLEVGKLPLGLTEHDHQMSHCKQKVTRDLSFLTISPDRMEATESYDKVDFLLADILGHFGGNLALFLGASLMTAIEILYWVFRSLNFDQNSLI